MTLHSPKSGATVSRVSVPAFVCPMRSFTVSSSFGDDLPSIRSRLARSLSIEDGDLVCISFEQVGMTVPIEAKIRDGMDSDVVIHDLRSSKLDLVRLLEFKEGGVTVTLNDGGLLHTPKQKHIGGDEVFDPE